jgi:hypothetical protein
MSFKKVKIMPSLKHNNNIITATNGCLLPLSIYETPAKYNFLNILIHNNETLLNKGERHV